MSPAARAISGARQKAQHLSVGDGEHLGHGARHGLRGRVGDVHGVNAPGHVHDRAAIENDDTGAVSSVADITTILRPSDARHAWRASASARSAWMLRS
jgi:hypothetical protein